MQLNEPHFILFVNSFNFVCVPPVNFTCQTPATNFGEMNNGIELNINGTMLNSQGQTVLR